MPVDHAVDGTVVSDANDSHGGMRAVDIRGEGGGALVRDWVDTLGGERVRMIFTHWCPLS